MSVKRKIRLFFVHLLLSRKTRAISRRLREIRRRLLRRPHVVSVFLQLDDPYSYLLAHYLPGFAEHYDIELCLHLSEALGDAYQPAPEMLAEYAVNDCERLARELGIPFLDKGTSPPVEHRLAVLDAIGASYGEENFDSELLQGLTAFWRGDAEAASRRRGSAETKGAADTVISDSQQLQIHRGHYNSAMLHYEGEWYWGVDRLPYLLDRLNDLGAARQTAPDRLLGSIRQATEVTLPVTPPSAAKNLPPLEFFHSIRADAYGLELQLRPVLPMVMRGMQVPMQKLLYILKDAAREAERLGIAFGRFADPVGTATERSLAVFRYADSEKRGREFLQNAGEAIWSQAVDVASDSGMRSVTGKTGLFWPDVKTAMEGDEWRAATEENRESMMASGCWGVPTMRIGDFAVWGQDRDWLLVRHIEELCDTGDGILV